MESLSGNLNHVCKSPFFTQGQTERGSLLQLVGLIPEFNLGGFEVHRKVIATAINNSKTRQNKQNHPKHLKDMVLLIFPLSGRNVFRAGRFKILL